MENSSGGNDLAAAIEIQGLTKRYKNPLGGELTAVENLDLVVERGEIFGFLGPNGAGKTTTIKVLLGLLFPTTGKVQVLGKPAGDNDIKKRVSYLPESPYFYEYMSARELLGFYSDLFKIPKSTRKGLIDGLLERVGLTNSADKPLRQYSKGMLQRAGIAQALLNDPDLVFLDEPTSGLDPIAHADICNLILDLKVQGKTVFVSSHQLSDIEVIGDRVAILVSGKLAMKGEVKELLATKQVEVIAEGVNDATADAVRKIADECEVHAGVMTTFLEGTANLEKIVNLVVQQSGATLISVNPRRRTLEKLFVDTVRGGR
jgi:ABC-2 type transport system ATP-binding protein